MLDGEKVFKAPGETIFIPLGSQHRAWNETDEEVIFIEVQTGTYFGEDDIVRLSDDYKRCQLRGAKSGTNFSFKACCNLVK